MNNISKIKNLTSELLHYCHYYYCLDSPIISDMEYDKKFDTLKELEDKENFWLSNSPTRKVQGEVLPYLEKIPHSTPMLSADKSTDINDIVKFKGNKMIIASYKLDGSTVVLKYQNGKLHQGLSRGSGIDGENITHTVKMIKNIPITIPYDGYLEIRGEALIPWCYYKEMDTNNSLGHPRNVASGALRQLDANEAAKRNIYFYAFTLVNWKEVCEKTGCLPLKSDTLSFLSSNGFDVVPHYPVPALDTGVELKRVIDLLDRESYQNPTDGWCFEYEDLNYGEQLGSTAHHDRRMYALKPSVEIYKTKLLDIHWTVGRSSVITPTAVFEPVEIDNTLVERASVHNVSVLTQLDLHVGDIIEVYKSNMIIPQVHRNISAENRINTDYIRIPGVCPVCDGATEIKDTENSKILICTNPDCAAKKLAQFTHFVSRNCMNIDGLSEKILEKLITSGMLYHCDDIYCLKEYKPRLMMMDGFGRKSVEKLLDAIEQSKNVKLENFIAALGIPNIGLSAAKTISKYFNGDYDKFIECVEYFDWTVLDDFGETMSASIKSYFANNYDMVTKLANYMNFELKDVTESSDFLNGKVFVVTGSLNHFDNRDALKGKIEALGGKVVGSISKKTDYLINNDVESTSSKNKKAKELNISIITEEQFVEMIGE